ncbi:MAG: VIT domain-containing protein [Pseudomonadota bacterium]
MNYKKGILGIWIVALLVMLAGPLKAQTEGNTDTTLSPYFFVKSDDPEVDQLPLKSTRADVSISGVIADVRVTQVYKNEGKRPLEAIYIFPASTRAAVYGMRMTIGERIITAKICEREKARKEYNQAKKAGKSASLLEQQRPNVFQMNVANIMPGDLIEVELKYTELLVPTDAVYGFIYPTVVGPRYVDQPANESGSSEHWTGNPYLHEGKQPTYTFNISVDISAGLPIKEVTCTSHNIHVDYQGPDLASIKLDPSEKQGGNRDFILKYRLAGKRIETGLLLFKGDEENFFLLMLQPPKRVVETQIPPREYIFIVDVSGSMHGFPLSISKKLLKDLISKLGPRDRFNVLLFAGGSHLLSARSLPATTSNIQLAVDSIDRQRGGGGTRLLPALRRALDLPKTEGYSRTVVIATDGYVAVEEETFDLIRKNLGRANIFAFGIGSSVNRHLIEGMARVGMGEPYVITKPEEAPQQAEKFRRLIASPVLTGIKVDFGKFHVYDVEPLSIPDVMADRPILVFGKWKSKPRGKITLRGFSGNHPFVTRLDISKTKPLETNAPLRYLWARHRIALLSDYNRLKFDDERVKEVTSLGLTYNLLTAYTSFIAVDNRVRQKNGEMVTVKQPLPLPQGVSDYAVGGRSFSKTALNRFSRAPMMALQKQGVREGEYLASAAPSESKGRIGIQLGDMIIKGELSEHEVRRILNRHLRSLEACFNNVQGRHQSITKKLVISMLIDVQGKVINVKMNKGGKLKGSVEKCMTEEIKRLRFPKLKSGENAVVTVTLILN